MSQPPLSSGSLEPIRRQLAEIKTSVVGLHRESRPPPLSGHERFVRHAVCQLCSTDSQGVEQIFLQRYLQRSAAAAGSSLVPNWVGKLTASDAEAFLATGVAPSLFTRLRALGAAVTLRDEQVRSVPFRAHGDPGGAWVGQGEPRPVFSAVLESVTMERRKVAGVVVLNAQVTHGSNATVEATIESIVRSDLIRLIDGALVDDQPGSGKRPPGLRFGVAALPAGESLQADLKALTAAVIARGGAAVLVLLNPVDALAFSGMQQPPAFLASAAVPLGTIIALDPTAFVSVLEAPVVTSSGDAVLHMETQPAPIVSDAGVPTAPSRSLWQTDAVGLLSAIDCFWAVVDQRLAWMQVSW